MTKSEKSEYDKIRYQQSKEEDKKKQYDRERYQRQKEEKRKENHSKILGIDDTKNDPTGISAAVIDNIVSSSEVSPISPPEPISDSERSGSLPIIESLSYFLLLILSGLITWFLLVESSVFYETAGSGNDTILMNPWIKALIVEGSLISLMILRGKTALSKLGLKILTIITFLFATYSFSSGIYRSKVITMGDNSTQASIISDLETQLGSKDKEVNLFSKKNWAINLKKSVKEQGVLRAELIEAKKVTKSTVIDVGAIKNEMVALIVFRLLLQVINLVFIRILADRYKKFNNKDQTP